MQFQQPFDARSIEPSSYPEPPKLADYHVHIVNSEGKPTNDGTGGYLEFTLNIDDPGPYLNRQVPYRLNIYNENAQTVEISKRQLSSLCYVTGVMIVQDSRQLWNIPFIATIGPQKGDPRYANVFAVKDMNGVQPGKSSGAPAAPAPPAPPAPAAWGAPPTPGATPAPWGAPPSQPPAPAYAAPPAAPGPPTLPWGAPAAPQPPAGYPAAPPAGYAAPPAPAVWQPPAPAAATPPAPAPWGAPGGAPPATPPWAIPPR